jgi:hypothetical protein
MAAQVLGGGDDVALVERDVAGGDVGLDQLGGAHQASAAASAARPGPVIGRDANATRASPWRARRMRLSRGARTRAWS